jgi:hypothetical protein
MTDNDVLTVALDPGDPEVSGLHRTVLASLPARFRVSPDGEADVALVSGNLPDWAKTARTGQKSGARAVMLAGTSALSAAAVRDFASAAQEADLIVGVDAGYAADGGWTDVLPGLRAAWPDLAVADSMTTIPAGRSLRAALVEQLAVVRSLLRDLDQLAPAHASATGYVLAGVIRGVTVTLSGGVSGAGADRLDIDLVSADRRWKATFCGAALASPTLVSVADADGERTGRPAYESAHRRSWLSLHTAVCRDAPVCYPPGDLVANLEIVETVLGAHRG